MSHVDPDRKREYNRLYRILNRDMINEKKRLRRKRNKGSVEVEVEVEAEVEVEDVIYECDPVLSGKVKQVGKIYDGKKLSYKALKYSPAGWINASVFLPLEFDLCTLKTQKGKCPGWHTGGVWVGLKLKKNDKVIAWKPDNNTCNKKTHKKTDNS